ncbi:ABC transporter permease [Stomatohabitans albus]|uniref:ABC transporter permease n=2 Tax=Stomatohabitans albus TaxID=3110766 RepID=UPI00300C46EC
MTKLIDLMKLELRRNNMKTYIISTIITCIIMIVFIYLFAYAPQIDPDPELQIFAGYSNVISLFSILSMAVFATMSAVMHTSFIIEEYKGKHAILLFTYPTKRSRIILAKLLVVSLFTALAMTLSNLISFTVFGISEQFSPLIDDQLNADIVIQFIKTTSIMAITAAGIGVISVGIGFIKKSVPTTIISGVLIASLLCNAMFNPISNNSNVDTLSIATMLITTIVALLVAMMLTIKVNTMEVL